MQNLQEIFNRVRETKEEQKEIRKMYKDALNASQEYKEIVEKLEGLRNKKKQIETELKEDSMNDFKKLDALRMHVQTDMEMISDMALNKLMSGETVEVVDADNNRYEPLFSVRFKKA